VKGSANGVDKKTNKNNYFSVDFRLFVLYSDYVRLSKGLDLQDKRKGDTND
jgi:hypothetical protein